MQEVKRNIITQKAINKYRTFLMEHERSKATIDKYIRDVWKYKQFLGDKKVRQESVIEWKNWLFKTGYKVSSINSMLAALNSFFEFMNWTDYKVRLVRVQKENFVKPERELTKKEYQLLVETAKKEGKERLCLIMQTICSTGIRISELPFITVNAILKGRAEIHLKGKIRTIFLPDYLRKILKRYIKKRKIREGAIFLTRGNIPVSRSNIWREMKTLCKKAGIEHSKVFPHNLRHLFARMHYKMYRDVIRLSDILGHSSVDTTRIYTLESGKTHIWQMNQLGLAYVSVDITT